MSQTKAQLLDGKSATIQYSAGSASTPAISFTGDTNTGIYSPGADQVAISTNGSGRLFVNSSGSVGIGTSNPQVRSHIVDTNGDVLRLQRDGAFTGSWGVKIGQAITGDFTLRDEENNLNVISIPKGSGRVGIGSSTPSGGQLFINSTLDASNKQLVLRDATNGWVRKIGVDSSNNMAFYDGDTERARIDSSGRLLVGTSSGPLINESQIGATGAGNTACLKTTVSSNNPLLLWNSGTSGNNIFCSFFTETSFTARASIDYNRGAGQVRYNTTSDQRLKSDIAPAPTALSKLSKIEVKSYKWTETDYLVEYGFIAQELNIVLPDAVKQGDDGDEVVNAWAIDNSKLVPLLTKALQEAIAKIETLETRLTALETP